MDRKEVVALKKDILFYLSKRQLKEAFEALTKLTVNTNDWKASEDLYDLETNYKYMLRYLFEGAEDPEREKMYNTLLRALYERTDDAADKLLKIDSSNIYYERQRVAELNPLNIKTFEKQLSDISESIALIDLVEDGADRSYNKRDLSIKRERIASDMFNSVFSSSRANEKDVQDYTSVIEGVLMPSREKCLLISALTLNLLHRFDTHKAQVLMTAATSDTVLVRARAIVGLVIVMQMYDIRLALYPELQHRIETLSENNDFRKSVLQVVIQLIRSRDTEKISKKITEEIIPEMMRFNNLSGRKLNMEELMGETDFTDKNPEWQKELEESGLGKKLQEYSHLQMEGADVFHSTFAGLKNYSFFYDLSNWFMPFDTSYSELQELFPKAQKNSILQAAIIDSGHMCNSDKYSFSLSLLRISSTQREMMLQRMGAESDEIKQMQKDAKDLNPSIDEEIISNQYIQDLYRFFKLNQSRSSFFDIFKLSLNFYSKKSFAPLISDEVSMRKIALYCFDKNYFKEALAIFELLVKMNENANDIWQKIGYCKQMLEDNNGALNAYLQADLIAPNNSWVLRRIANLYRLSKMPELALAYYKKTDILVPDNVAIALNIGHCYLEIKEYENALNCYFKVELSDTKNIKAQRPIAWVAFLLGKYELAQKYYRLILNNKPTVHDYLNAGHVELCMGNKKSALDFYVVAAEKELDMEQFILLFESDKQNLIDKGINADLFLYLFDQIRYKLD